MSYLAPMANKRTYTSTGILTGMEAISLLPCTILGFCIFGDGLNAVPEFAVLDWGTGAILYLGKCTRDDGRLDLLPPDGLRCDHGAFLFGGSGVTRASLCTIKRDKHG